MELFHILLGILIFYVIYTNIEPLENENTKTLTTYLPCKNCKIWNHVDAKTKCEKTCQKDNPDKPSQFSGVWKTNRKNPQDSICECTRTGLYTKNYVGCPLGTTFEDKKDCFIWNDNEATTECPKMCKTFLTNKDAKWTGNWKPTSASSSACECEYYE